MKTREELEGEFYGGLVRTAQEWRRFLEKFLLPRPTVEKMVGDMELLEEQLEIYKSDRVVLNTRIQELQFEIDEMVEARKQGRDL